MGWGGDPTGLIPLDRKPYAQYEGETPISEAGVRLKRGRALKIDILD